MYQSTAAQVFPVTRFLFFQLHYCLFSKRFFLSVTRIWAGLGCKRQRELQTHRQSTGNFLEALEAFLVLGVDPCWSLVRFCGAVGSRKEVSVLVS